MLKLAHPAPKGQGTDPPKGRRSPALSLTDTEAMHLRAALRGLRALHGDWEPLVQAMGLSARLLHIVVGGRRHPSPAIALLASRVARTTIERVLNAGPISAEHDRGARGGSHVALDVLREPFGDGHAITVTLADDSR